MWPRRFNTGVWIRGVGGRSKGLSCFNPIKEKRDVVANTPLIEHLIKEKFPRTTANNVKGKQNEQFIILLFRSLGTTLPARRIKDAIIIG
jgi:hypothetical protein